MNWESSQTFQNLKTAFAAEAMASMRYHYYATTARREKMVHLCELFSACEKYELEHAKMWYKQFHDGGDTTAANLSAAVAFEGESQQELYARFARQAREEGYEDLAVKFEQAADIAAENRGRFEKWLARVTSDRVFVREEPVRWQCSNCGNTIHGKSAPETCPVCEHGRAYYRVIHD